MQNDVELLFKEKAEVSANLRKEISEIIDRTKELFSNINSLEFFEVNFGDLDKIEYILGQYVKKLEDFETRKDEICEFEMLKSYYLYKANNDE